MNVISTQVNATYVIDIESEYAAVASLIISNLDRPARGSTSYRARAVRFITKVRKDSSSAAATAAAIAHHQHDERLSLRYAYDHARARCSTASATCPQQVHTKAGRRDRIVRAYQLVKSLNYDIISSACCVMLLLCLNASVYKIICCSR